MIYDKVIKQKFSVLKDIMSDGMFVDGVFYNLLQELTLYIQYQLLIQRREPTKVEHGTAVQEIEQFLKSVGYVPHISTIEGILYHYVESLLTSVKLMGMDYTRENLNHTWKYMYLARSDQERYDEVWES